MTLLNENGTLVGGGISMLVADHVEILRKHLELDNRLVKGESVFLSEMESLLRRARVCQTGRRETLHYIERAWKNRVRYTQRNGGRGLRWRGLDPSPTVFR